MGKCSSVLQEWTEKLSFMQQSVLITATRGPDTLPKNHTAKDLCRWLRRCYLLSAFDKTALLDPTDPRGGNFTGPCSNIDKALRDYLSEIDGVPHHFHMHLVHAAEILGYKHPIPWIRGWWNSTYLLMVKDLHLRPESEDDLDRRLGDRKVDWESYRWDVPDG